MEGMLAIFSVFIGAPIIVFSFVFLISKNKQKVKLEELKNERLALEVEKERLHLTRLEAENRKLDRLIGSGTDEGTL